MAMKIERGEIWWINLDPTVGREIKKKRPLCGAVRKRGQCLKLIQIRMEPALQSQR